MSTNVSIHIKPETKIVGRIASGSTVWFTVGDVTIFPQGSGAATLPDLDRLIAELGKLRDQVVAEAALREIEYCDLPKGHELGRPHQEQTLGSKKAPSSGDGELGA